ncbi:unnamed protein product, partial [Rotaria sp. Silwood1]
NLLHINIHILTPSSIDAQSSAPDLAVLFRGGRSKNIFWHN